MLNVNLQFVSLE